MAMKIRLNYLLYFARLGVQCPWRPEEGNREPVTGVTDRHELLHIGTRNRILVLSARAVHTHNL